MNIIHHPFKGILLSAVAVLGLCACGHPSATSDNAALAAPIRVGVFNGHGGAETCKWETFEAVKLDKGMTVRFIGSSDIAAGCLDSLDAIIFPGGGGSTEYLNLGPENVARVKTFIRNGGGAVGICAGAYLFSNTPDYACMRINGAKSIDVEHDNRGHGVSKFTLSAAGKELFPELASRDTCYVMYYEGPVFVDAQDSIGYEVFATMESDVHEEGNAPSGMTNGKPFFIGNAYGKGRVFSSIAHPEATPGMRWMIPRIVRWTLRKDYPAYSDNAVRPDLFNREILFTRDMLRQESAAYSTFLYATPEEKIATLDWLQEHLSWDAKRWVQGLVYDASPKVRARTAQYIAGTEWTWYLPDLIAASAVETDPEAKAAFEQAIALLKGL